MSSELSAVLLGAILAGGGKFLYDARTHRRECVALKNGIEEEIRTLTEIIKVRGYMDGIEEVIRGMEKNPEWKPFLRIRTRDTHLPFLEANLSKLGYLDKQFVRDVVSFKHYMEAIILDVSPGGTVHDGNASIGGFRQLKVLGERMISLGEKIGGTN